MIKHAKRAYLKRQRTKRIRPVHVSLKCLRHLHPQSPRLQTVLRLQAFPNRLRRTLHLTSRDSYLSSDRLYLELHQRLAPYYSEGSWWQELFKISGLILFGLFLLTPLLSRLSITPQDPDCFKSLSCSFPHLQQGSSDDPQPGSI